MTLFFFLHNNGFVFCLNLSKPIVKSENTTEPFRQHSLGTWQDIFALSGNGLAKMFRETQIHKENYPGFVNSRQPPHAGTTAILILQRTVIQLFLDIFVGCTWVANQVPGATPATPLPLHHCKMYDSVLLVVLIASWVDTAIMLCVTL